jgi:hypothetical protein
MQQLEIATTTCLPLGTEVTPELRDMLLEPDFRTELEGYADEVEANNVRRADDLETGAAAERGIQKLGCAACILSDVCAIKGTLDEKVGAGAQHEAFMETATMLASAPKWLTAARINRSGIDGVDMLTRLRSSDEAERLYAAGELPLESFLGSVKNHISGEVTKADVPVLARMAKIEPEKPLTVHEITTLAATYDVIDASDAVGYKGDQIGPREYGNLASKVLNRMEELDSTGKPQIFTADNTMQKVISKFGDATLFEMRMQGKNRMYFWASQPPEQNPQIVIIGSHGGDESSQRDFINNYVG